MNNKQVAHIWAHQSRSSASGSHFFFDGETIFSYGRHFPIARHFKGVVLFTSKGYSSSTARHKSYVSQAINHLTSFTVSDVLRDPCKADLVEYRENIKAAALTAARARNPDSALIALEKLVAEANHFASRFGFKTKFTVPSGTDLAALKLKAKASAERERKAALVKKQKQEEAAQETITKWLAGEQVTIPYNISRVFLRARQIAEQGVPTGHMVLESSKGAVVPLGEAKVAFHFISSKRESGWHHNGETCKVGDFQIDAVNEQGVVAGCHRIEWAEIERFAKLQGW